MLRTAVVSDSIIELESWALKPALKEFAADINEGIKEGATQAQVCYLLNASVLNSSKLLHDVLPPVCFTMTSCDQKHFD